MWLAAAILSSVFAGLTAILAKCGIKKTDSDIATAIRTIVVLAFSWLMVFVAGSAKTITQINPRSLLFLILSGAATGASWMCYFKALSIGDVNKVVPIDKSSTILSVLLAIICFGETEHLFFSWREAYGFCVPLSGSKRCPSYQGILYCHGSPENDPQIIPRR